MVVTTIDVPIAGGVGDRNEHPSNSGEIQRTYELAIGQLRIDFTGLRLPAGATRVKARVGIGQLTVVVPQDVAVQIVAKASLGQVAVLGRESSGVNARV
jgi:predicted membrane protein